MPANDHEVFAQIVQGDEAKMAIDFLTYASFAFERAQWIEHATLANGGIAPDQDAINTWISNITAYQFDQMRARAATTFDVAARQYMAIEVEAARQQALQDAVLREVASATEAQKLGLGKTLSEVKAAGGFWRQTAIALTTAILTPILIGGVLVFALMSEKVMPTIAGVKDAITKQAAPQDAAKPEGQR